MRFPAGDKRELTQLVSTASRALFNWKYGSGQGESSAETRLRRHAQSVLWQLRRAFESAVGTGFIDEIIRLITEIAPPSSEMKEALVAWVALVEVLVQEAEQEYGSARGRGAQKAQQVKAALIHLMIDRPQLRIPEIPEFLVPLIVEVGVNWTIDAIVTILNRNTLWEPGGVVAHARPSIFARGILWLLRLWRSFVKLPPVAWLFGRLARLGRRIVLMAYPLSPGVRAAVERIEATRGSTIEDAVLRGVAVVRWIVNHQKEVMALIDVVAFAIQEAEFIGALSGPEKKIYARALILAFFEDVGIVGGPSSLTYQLLDGLLDGVIDAVVAIFNSRSEAFGKSRKKSPYSSLDSTPPPLVREAGMTR
jgi:hypothetical protein